MWRWIRGCWRAAGPGAIAVALLLGWCWLLWSYGWSDGYAAGALAAVQDLGTPQRWGSCESAGRWQRCARLDDGRLVLVRGVP